MGESEESIAGVILAGGQSSRMLGEDKCFALVGNLPLIQHAIDRAQSQVNPLLLNVNPPLSRFHKFNLPLIEDQLPGHAGPLAGLMAAMEYLTAYHPRVSHLASFPVDSPFYPENLVDCLYSGLQSNRAQIAIPRYRGQAHWVFGLWSPDLLSNLRHFLIEQGQRKVQDWIASQKHYYVNFDEYEQDPFVNINTREDLALAQARLLNQG